jgi:hypothetical protein
MPSIAPTVSSFTKPRRAAPHAHITELPADRPVQSSITSPTTYWRFGVTSRSRRSRADLRAEQLAHDLPELGHHQRAAFARLDRSPAAAAPSASTAPACPPARTMPR